MELGKSIEKQNDVVVRLARHVITTVAEGSNLVFSPTSINVLLSIIAAGSSSVTKHQILSFLNSPSTDHLNTILAEIVSVALRDVNNVSTSPQGQRSSPCQSIDGLGPDFWSLLDARESSGVRLSAANGVWIDKSVSLKPSFKDILENSYKASCSQVDFFNKPGEVIDEVNTWAEVHTNGLIKHILLKDSIEEIRESTLILANAVYFKGAWSEKFNARFTKDNDFYLLDGTSVKVPFMTSHKDHYLRSYDGFQVLRLPYVEEDQRQFSMYIYLPDARDGLPTLLEKIGSEPGFLDNHIPNNQIELDALKIPKFKFFFEFKASSVLKDMGLTSPFTSSGGGLTEMVDSPTIGEKLYVSNILHKACIEVDEEGTEAAAVSVGVIRCLCLMKNPHFIADHPFLFTVREDRSGVILFMGQVLDPSKH